MKEFNLSEKIDESQCFSDYEGVIKALDVKEFIRRLKASPDFDDEDRAFIDKLAGGDLV